MAPQTFESLFCAHFKCSADRFPKQAFRRCLYLRARPLRPLLLLLDAEYFARDLDFIHQLAASTSMQDVRAAAKDFEDANRWPRTFLRSQLKMRVSGKKAIRLGRLLFAFTAPEAPAPAATQPASALDR